jgi:hypothetical protein
MRTIRRIATILATTAGLAACGTAPWDRPQPAQVFHSHAEAERFLAADIGQYVRAYEAEDGEDEKARCSSSNLQRARGAAENRTEDAMLRRYVANLILDLGDVARRRGCLDDAEAIYRDVAVRHAGPNYLALQARAANAIEDTRRERERLRALERAPAAPAEEKKPDAPVTL